MPLGRRTALLGPLALLPGWAAAAPPALSNVDIVLLQPEEQLRERLPDTAAFARYLQALQLHAASALESTLLRPATGGFLVLALRPGGGVRGWLDMDLPLPAPLQTLLLAALQATPAPGVHGGPVVFALKASLWGGRLTPRAAPAPTEWREAARQAGRRLPLDELLQAVWPG